MNPMPHARPRRPRLVSHVIWFLGLLTAGLLAVAAAPPGKAEDVGLSAERLQRIDQLIDRYIDDHQIAGAITVVNRRGRTVHFDARGLMDLESRAPMKKDAIFRMASMTKPVTGVAILMLLEEGKIRLSDPVSRFIPEFASPSVAVVKPKSPPAGASAAASASPNEPSRAPDIYTVPATREITIKDLLTHTSGLESGGAGSREAARLAPRGASDTLAGYVPKLGSAPLDFQPGSEWRYSALAGIDTLARIVETVSGLTFDRFLKQRIFDPLGMTDTAFFPAGPSVPRVATLYGLIPGGLRRQETPAWLATTTLFSGGGGLWSTADDYTRFAAMLTNGGELSGRRLLSPRTIDLMAANHVGTLYADSTPTGSRRGMGFGLTVEVVLDPIAAGRRTSAGSFGWDGAFGTHFWVDRKEQLTGILLIQQAVNPALNRDFENAVMQAIVD